jgi:hypothetical protein
MEHTSSAISLFATTLLLGMMGVLIARRRAHLRLVVRVIGEPDHKLIGYLDRLVQDGRLAPATTA